MRARARAGALLVFNFSSRSSQRNCTAISFQSAAQSSAIKNSNPVNPHRLLQETRARRTTVLHIAHYRTVAGAVSLSRNFPWYRDRAISYVKYINFCMQFSARQLYAAITSSESEERTVMLDVKRVISDNTLAEVKYCVRNEMQNPKLNLVFHLFFRSRRSPFVSE